MNSLDVPTIKDLRPHGNAKLTFEQIREIRKRLAEGVAPKVICIDFNIATSTLYGIRYGLTYRRVV